MNDWQAMGDRQAKLPDGPRSRRARKLRQSLRDPMYVEVTDRVRRLIIREELKQGDRIYEDELAEDLGVSRTPLRDALKTLQEEGLTEIRPHRGTYVTYVDVEHTEELFEALAGVERICGELATRKITEEQLEWFRAIHEEMYELYRGQKKYEYFEANQRIHMAFAALSDNPQLITIHGRLMNGAERGRLLALETMERWGGSVDEHKAILAAVERRDADEAGRLISQHVLQTCEVVCRIIRQRKDTENLRGGRRPLYDSRLGIPDRWPKTE